MDKTISDRFGGVARVYGEQQAQWLSTHHILIIGLGGVGSWAAESLARSGVSKLTLVDLDDICITNTNRQLHALQSTLGKCKIEVMKQRIEDINPHCQVTIIHDFLTTKNIETLVSKEITAVLDAIDSVHPKAALLNYCRRLNLPVVATGGAGGLVDPFQIQVADLSKTIQDPLAAKTRQLLRREYGFPKGGHKRFGIDCVFSTEPVRYPQANGEVSLQKKMAQQNQSRRLDCQGGLGASVMVTASFGMMAAAHLVNQLLKRMP